MNYSKSNYNPDCYNSHSLRIGKATDMAKVGCSDYDIKSASRWKTNAFKAYIRPQEIYVK